MQSVHQCSDGSGRLFVSGSKFYVVSETHMYANVKTGYHGDQERTEQSLMCDGIRDL